MNTTDSAAVAKRLEGYKVSATKIEPAEVMRYLEGISFPAATWEPIHKVFYGCFRAILGLF
jgi:hypothetical protein